MPAAAAIPIIDIAAEGVDEAEIAKALVDAAVEHGFVYIKNAGKDISAKQVENAFDISRTLFNSPIEEKERCKIQKNNRGWSGMHTETLDPQSQRVGDFKEAFNFGPFPNAQPSQPLPDTILPHVTTIASFRSACHALCQRLLHLFGLGLSIDPPSFFAGAHDPSRPSGSTLRFLYYPASSGATASRRRDGDVRAGAHSDYGSVTLLFRLRGQAGLEVLTRTATKDGDGVRDGNGNGSRQVWAPVPVCPPGTENDETPPILVNIGDLLSYWTNGLLRSTVHRVVFGGGGAGGDSGDDVADRNGPLTGESDDCPRYSIVYFCHPADETLLGPVPSERVREFRGDDAAAGGGNPYAQRRVLTADEHLQMRLRASYLQMYEEKDGRRDVDGSV